MNRVALPIAAGLMLAGCGRYRDFTLPAQAGEPREFTVEWRPRAEPVLERGDPGAWDSVDALNPSVVRTGQGYLNFYSGFDGSVWRTGVATSADGIVWTKQARPVLSPARDEYIAANGSALPWRKGLLYYYQSGRTPVIRKARATVIGLGPEGSLDERGAADPYAIETGGRLYMYYLGMDRARRQRLGVAMSEDGLTWYKLRSNPVLEPGDFGAFDEHGVGEPAVWTEQGFYWMLYTGRARDERRRLGIAQSADGVHWRKLSTVIAGDRPWDSQVICDPTVLVENGQVRVWFGGGDVPKPDENIHGRIGYGVLTLRPR